MPLSIDSLFLGASVFTYFSQSNLAGKFVCIGLIVFSLLAWTVMIGKFLDLSRLRNLNMNFENKLSDATRLLRISMKSSPASLGPYACLLSEALKACNRYRGEVDERTVSILMGHVENAIQRSVSQQTIRYESKMILLASIVTASPFMGLLGTVWGVMDAFGGIALQNSATLQNLAPGVSGALLTTVAGLLVAIPSVLGYNFLLSQSKLLMTELENFASSLADRIELELEDPE